MLDMLLPANKKVCERRPQKNGDNRALFIFLINMSAVLLIKQVWIWQPSRIKAVP